MKGLMISQMQQPSLHVEEGLMVLLQNCLEIGAALRNTLHCSYILHFENKLKEDLGWDCSWCNIQMMSSYLLTQDGEARDKLFGGTGFVPDIPAPQQWLE
jgi:hypothetical protein